MKPAKIGKDKLVGMVLIVIFLAIVAFYIQRSSSSAPFEIPSAAKGDVRVAYQFAIDHPEILKNVPCYCGCKYEGHKNSYDCFWKEDGSVDRHGLSCSICVDIAVQSKELYDQGKDLCEIRNAIDTFYVANKDLATPTPMPEGCSGEGIV